MRTSDTRPSALRLSASALMACIALATAAFAAETVAQKTFPSAEAAVTAVVDDLRSENLSDLMAILGPGADRLLNSGDPVADRRGRERFAASYNDAHHLEQTPDGAVLVVGKDDWSVPILGMGVSSIRIATARLGSRRTDLRVRLSPTG